LDVQSFAEIEEEFLARVKRIVWCTVATVDTRGRPRTRILHPVWEGTTGWIATGRHSLKEKHLAKNPYVSLTYWDAQHKQVYAECRAEWEDNPAEKQRVYDLFKSLPMPYGYDPAMIWKDGLADPTLGFLKLTPDRIELSQMSIPPAPPQVWRPK
jgi:general stress protein 26